MTFTLGLPKAQVLTYRFHDFRPTDREELRKVAVAQGGDRVFTDALTIYLEKWAEADWLQEYDLERIALWMVSKLPKSVVDLAVKDALAHKTGNSEQRGRTYSAFLDAVTKERSGKSAPTTMQLGA